MTLEDLKKIPFKCVSHMTGMNEHVTMYMSTDPELCVEMSVRQPYRNGLPHGKCYRHYMWNGKVYKSVDALLKAINQSLNDKKE